MGASERTDRWTRGRVFVVLATLYVAQGLPFGFFTQTLPVLMRQQQISLGAIGLAQLLAIPWALKFVWAPLVDRYGTRRAWILPLQAVSIVIVLGASFFDPLQGFAPVLALVLAANLVAATQDIATDALAVNLLDARSRGIGNGIQVAGFRVGMILGGGALLVLYGTLGWSGATRLLAAGLLATTLPVLQFRETPAPAARAPAPRLRDSWSWLALPGATAWLAVLLAYKTGDALATGMLKTFLVDGGIDIEGIGRVLGYVGFAAGFAGALAGGALTTRLGRRRAVVAFGLAQAASVAAYALAAHGVSTVGPPPAEPLLPLRALYVLAALEHFTGGLATAALFTAMMDACRPERAGTDYTLQASAVVIATGAAQGASGFIAEPLGYAPFFLLAAALSAAGTLFVAAIWPRTLAATPQAKRAGGERSDGEREGRPEADRARKETT